MGANLGGEGGNCSQCTWPYDPSGWAQNRLPLHRTTLDTSCANARREGLGVVDDVAVTAELRALCAEWRALLEEDPPIAQQIVRKFLTERLTVERTPKGIRLTGMATFGPLMAGIVMRGAMVPPGGTLVASACAQ